MPPFSKARQRLCRIDIGYERTGAGGRADSGNTLDIANCGDQPTKSFAWTEPLAGEDMVPAEAFRPGLVNLLSGLSRAHLVCHPQHMNTLSINRYKHHRFSAEIISHGVWLYFRFCLSYRDVEELLFARDIIVTYEAIRKWCRTFGQP